MPLFTTKDLCSQTSMKVETEGGFELLNIPKGPLKFAQDEDLTDVFSELQEHEIILYFTNGRWSMHQLIKHICEVIGACEVTLCTWAMTEKPLATLQMLKQKGQITKLTGLFEDKITTKGKGYAFAKQFFDETFLTRIHAKVTVFENENYSVTVFSSSNLTKNRRVEAGTIICDKETAHWARNYILSLKKDGIN